MGKTKSIIILIGLLLLAVPGLAIEDGLSRDFSNSVDERLETLQIYFETGLYSQAAQLLDQLISEYPDETRFTYLRAIVAYEQQDYDQAQKVFLQFIEDYPQVAEPYYLLGEISLKQKNLEQAEVYLRRYCELVPEDYTAHRKLELITNDNNLSSTPTKPQPNAVLIRDGRKEAGLVGKIGFYGGCVRAYQAQSIKLINGSFCTWSSMGIDFNRPLDLRHKQIVLTLKGKRGGEKLQVVFRDQSAVDYQPQLAVAAQEALATDWRQIKIALDGKDSDIDLSSIVHMGIEFGHATVRNPPQSTLFVKDIVIEDVDR